MATDAAVQFLNILPSPEQALAGLAPPLRAWFQNTYPAPTLGQRLAWPTIARGGNFMLAAPTGSGKTLAALLPILGQLQEENQTGLQCLYVAPLKALCNDAAKNVAEVIRQITPRLDSQARPIHVGLRTGDISSNQRRHDQEQPPAIFMTTPESLALLLSNACSLEMLQNVRWIVVDEVHAFVGARRGADLSLALERLDYQVQSTGNPPPQRLGLSATCTPLAAAAAFLVGANRSCQVAHVADEVPFTLDVAILAESQRQPGFIGRLLQRLEPEFTKHRTTLLFTDTRALAERLTWGMKRRFPAWIDQIGIHHGSLSLGQRNQVEDLLKRGKLRIVVSSSSLELGIDIGSVDQVVMIHPPAGVARLLQRVGRSGHGPGRLRRGLILTASPGELLESAVAAASGRASQLESLPARVGPLDVLCQHLVGLAMTGWWSAAEVLPLLRGADPYRDLTAADFQDCLDYLSGKDSRGQDWLPARLTWRDNHFTMVGPRMSRLLRRNLGTIVAEDQRPVRLIVPGDFFSPGGSDASGPTYQNLGQLDDSFANSLQPGDRFMLEGRCLEFRQPDGKALLVEEQTTRPQVPHWNGGTSHLTRELAERTFVERARAAEALRDGDDAILQFLAEEWRLHGEAAEEIRDWLGRQESASEVPFLARQLIEVVAASGMTEYYWHTPMNRAGNAAVAAVLAWRVQRDLHQEVRPWPANLGFLLAIASPVPIRPDSWRALARNDKIDHDLKEAWRDCPSLRERFAAAAQVGLMVLRNPLGGSRRVGGSQWVQQRLFDQIQEHSPDFLLLRQAHQELAQEGDAAAQARHFFANLVHRPLLCRSLSQTSPFASAWFQQPHVTETPVTSYAKPPSAEVPHAFSGEHGVY